MARVLVIDDDTDLLVLCRVNLEHAGHEVHVADRADAGLALARELAPDAVILDVMMPERDGFDLLNELAADNPSLPVLMLTVRSYQEDQIRGWRSGAAGYIIKPFSPQELVEAVSLALIESGDEREAHRRDALRRLSDEGSRHA
jgi:DNA-binding response OmpR family regulator